jgi:O-antigen ligase
MAMNSTVIVEGQPDDHRALLIGMAACAAVLLLLTTALFFTGRTMLAIAPLIAVAGLLVVSHPRLALYQYLFVLFIQWELVESLPLYATDVSAVLLIAAALLDILLSARLPSRLPRLTLNFAALLLAVFVAAALGSDPATSLRSLLRLSFLLLTFLSVYRLVGKIEVDRLVRLFFWLCVLHAVIVLAGFVALGGTQRSWGFSPTVFDGLAMMTLPVGMCLYLWDRSGKVGLYLIGSVLVMGALISTQSRFSTFLGLALTALVMVLSWRRYRRILKGKVVVPADSMATTPVPQVNRRLLVVAAATLGVSISLLAAKPFILESVFDRFSTLISSPAGETVYLRLTLWSFAVKAFLANPLTGIGPGCFRYVQEIIPTLRLTEVGPWVRGLTAHNLFLHYLAETGLIGATALAALFINQYRYGRRIWKSTDERTNNACSLALYIISTLFLVTTFLEAGWFWGQTAYAFVFFVALIVRHFHRHQSALLSDGPR